MGDLGWLSVETPRKPAVDVKALANALAKLQAREKRLAERLKELDTDDLFDTVIRQLRDLRGMVNDAKMRLARAQQDAAVSAAPATIGDLEDRAALASALRQRIATVRFGDSNRVEIHSKAGIILSVHARESGEKPLLAIRRPDGQMATFMNGQMKVLDAPDGMPAVDWQTLLDFEAYIRRCWPR